MSSATGSAVQDSGQPQASRTRTSKAFAAASATSKLAPHSIQRRAPGPRDVQIEISHCGVCHSDLHQVRNEWESAMPTVYPCVPGHEIVGKVSAVGREVRGFKVGDTAAVGCMVDSDRTCASCRAGEEQYCESMPTFTYNFPDKHLGGVTFGGYSESLVVDEAYTLRVPDRLDPAGTAPLLCAGITTYSPLRQWDCHEGDRVAVVGLGGLGHLAVKMAVSMGAEVTVFSTSRSKAADARRLGAREFELTKDKTSFPRRAGRFHLVIDTVAGPHDYEPYLALLRPRGTLVVLGFPARSASMAPPSLASGSERVAGSAFRGISETQEMLDYCAERGIVSDVEVIPIQEINEAYERVLEGNVRYRFVIDLKSLEG